MADAGYSGTPLAKKLGIKPGHRLALFGAPADVLALLTPQLPFGVNRVMRLSRRQAQPCDVILYFTAGRAALAARLSQLKNALDRAGGLWLCWPKRASGWDTDLSDNIVRELGLAAGLVDNKVCAVDVTWSALRFVYRLVDRPARRVSANR